MTSEIETESGIMKVVERSYFTPSGWRLATFREAEQNLEMIKQHQLLEKHKRARLLDGWISGPRYDFQMGDEFRRFLGYMLIIEIQSSANNSSGNSGLARSIYEGVTLTLKGREVALLLCAYDWNYEVVYWLLNSWEKGDTFNSLDVRGGKLTLMNRTTFEEMNRMICSLGRILGKEGLDSQKAARKKLSEDSVKEVMVSMGKSCWDKFNQKHKNILGKEFLATIDKSIDDIIRKCSEVKWFQNFASQEDTLDVIWNFFWYYISFNAVAGIVHICFSLLMKDFCSEECRARSQRDFIMSTAVLHYILEYEKQEGKRILQQACKDAAGDDWQLFKNTLRNRSTAYYDKIGDYHVLNKILIYAAKREDSFLVNKVLEWGAQPQANLGPDKQNRALHYAIGKCTSMQILKSLFDKCDSKEEFANAENEKGMTALHLACYHADMSMCEMVIDYGGRPNVQDNRGRLPLHYIVGVEDSDDRAKVLRSLFDKCRSKEEFCNGADDEGMTALHWACRDADVSVCKLILEYGGKLDVQDNKGCLPLHYAVDGTAADRKEIIKNIFDKCDSKEKLANAENKEGMTALHCACRAADVSVCEMLLEYGGRANVPDNKGRLPLHYAVEKDNESIVDVLIRGDKSGTVQNQDVSELDPKREMVNCKDNKGESPLDMAVKEYKIKIMVKLLSVSRQPLEIYLNQVDSAKLLRELASEGNSEFVEKLLQTGVDTLACDSEGRTALHHGSMCENDYNAWKVTELMLAKCTSKEKKEKWVETEDKHGQTALYFAAMKGHERLCDCFCAVNTDKLQINDADGPGLVFDVVKGGPHDNPEIILSLLRIGQKKSIIDWDRRESAVDHSGLTLLHVAASNGRKYIADALLNLSKNPIVYVRTPDVLGETALHKAAKAGHADTVKVLMHWGADPLLERDSNGRTALHWAVQSESEDQAMEVAELLLKKCGSNEKKLLLLWASAAGLGTVDQQLPDSKLKSFLLNAKNCTGKEGSLLRTAACLCDIDMTKELLTRGAQFGDIKDQNWFNGLNSKQKLNVNTVCKQIERIAEQGNDQPTISDNLGRRDFAYGLAALLLNPYLKPPITVGITGSWGTGKSSLMLQTEGILLRTAAQLAILPSKSSETEGLSFPGVQILEHTEEGEEKYQEIKTMVEKYAKYAKRGDSLSKFLNKYKDKHHRLYKLLAAMDSSYMFKSKDQPSESEIASPTEGSVAAILTVRYNAWKYRNESEALAGMAVEITKEMEGIMTEAQWLSTCFRNTWRKQKQVFWIEVIFPCLLAVLLAISFTWILWLLLERHKIKQFVELKYASVPLTAVIMAWILVKKVMSAINPVSAQLMNYIKLPDHAEKLGYQEQVISDITFLKEEISKKPYSLCIAASYIWHCIISLQSSKYRGEILASSIPSANLRTVVFVDDLDRCQESVILQVLAAVNLVLAVCKINVILGMDSALIQRALTENYEVNSLGKSKKLANKYLQKIIQLPLDLPDPSEEQSEKFLNRHLGVFQKQRKEGHSESETDAEDDSIPEIDTSYNDLFSPFEQLYGYEPDFTTLLKNPEGSTSEETKEPGTPADEPKDLAIVVQYASETNGSSSRQTGSTQTLWQKVMQCIRTGKTNNGTESPQEDEAEGDESLSELIRQLLFMTYSKAEQNVFDYFQKMATDTRKNMPREWKRLLNYHRLVWNIFLINKEAKDLDGWQVQLITWIFICWEWEENINILIKNWESLRALEGKPSLRMIVDHFIRKESWIIADDKSEKDEALGNSADRDTTPQNLEEEKKEDPVSSNLEPPKLEVSKDEMTASMEPRGDVSDATNHTETRNSVEKEKLKEVVTKEEVRSEKTLKNELEVSSLKVESKEQLDRTGKLQEQLDRIEKLQAELKKQVDSIVKERQVWRNEKSAEEKKLKSESWRRLKFALKKYDVSMEGIQAFQRFRLYCVAGHLPWPLPERKL